MKLRKKCDIAFLMKMVNKKIVIFVHIHILNIIQFSKNVTYCLCFKFFLVFLSIQIMLLLLKGSNLSKSYSFDNLDFLFLLKIFSYKSNSSISESIQVHSVTEFTIYFQTASILKTDLTTNTFLCVKVQVQLNFNSTTISNIYFTRMFF